MARSFSEKEKQNIKKCLLDACKQHWTQFGYKKTSVDELCKQAGISKGAFYLFFESKEALFCEVLCLVQSQIYGAASKIIEEDKTREGIARALKLIYREYDKNNFLYRSDSQDFTILMNKVSEEQAKKIMDSNRRNQLLFSNLPHLKCKVNPDLAAAVIYSLIMNIKNRDVLPYSHVETFDFMVERLVDTIFEEKTTH